MRKFWHKLIQESWKKNWFMILNLISETLRLAKILTKKLSYQIKAASAHSHKFLNVSNPLLLNNDKLKTKCRLMKDTNLEFKLDSKTWRGGWKIMGDLEKSRRELWVGAYVHTTHIFLIKLRNQIFRLKDKLIFLLYFLFWLNFKKDLIINDSFSIILDGFLKISNFLNLKFTLMTLLPI